MRQSSCEGESTAGTGSHTRSQAEVLGLVLLFGIIITGAVAVVVVGSSAIGDTKEQLSVSRAEKSLTQFDSEASLVAQGGTDTRSMSLAAGSSGQYEVDGDEGWMRVNITDGTGSPEMLVNITLGRVTYDTGADEIAYQGGGVWRASEAGGEMVSPPEFHFQNKTLTLPAVNITGETKLRDDTAITHVATEKVYPNASRNSEWVNPVEDHKINITVQSEFYRGWGEYFEERTNSTVEYNHDANKVNVTLVPPPQPVELNSGVVASGDLNIDGVPFSRVTGGVSLGGTTNDEGAIDGDVEENVNANTNLETAASKISSARSRLQGESPPSDFSTVDAGTYFVANDQIFQSDTSFDTSSGDIEIFVDGDVSAAHTGGPPWAPPEVDITGDGNVKIYVDGQFHMDGQTVWGKSSQVDSLTVYSHEVDRITEYYGVIYTDAVAIDGSGSDPDLTGGIISTASSIDMGGNVNIEYDSSLENTEIQEVEVEFAEIAYLHISESTIEIE